jgi:hypothetical protein
MITDRLLDDFIALYEKRFGIALNRDQARIEADKLIRFTLAAVREGIEPSDAPQ